VAETKTLVIRDDTERVLTLTTGSSATPVVINPAWTVNAQFLDEGELITTIGVDGVVSVLEATSGSDWANGVIVVPLTAVETASLAKGTLVEPRVEIIETTNGNKHRTFCTSERWQCVVGWVT